jgi:hypothetical protein
MNLPIVVAASLFCERIVSLVINACGLPSNRANTGSDGDDEHCRDAAATTLSATGSTPTSTPNPNLRHTSPMKAAATDAALVLKTACKKGKGREVLCKFQNYSEKRKNKSNLELLILFRQKRLPHAKELLCIQRCRHQELCQDDRQFDRNMKANSAARKRQLQNR